MPFTMPINIIPLYLVAMNLTLLPDVHVLVNLIMPIFRLFEVLNYFLCYVSFTLSLLFYGLLSFDLLS